MRWSYERMVCIAAGVMVWASAAVAAPQRKAQQRTKPSTVNVVMLSDVHFDPFFDPAKFAELRSAPTAQWPAILSKPDSASRAKTFQELQSGCGVRGVDSPWPLVAASLREAKQQEPAPLFVTVSGDLLAHGFICKFRKLAGPASPEEASAFASKTVSFVAHQLHAAFPSVPVYFALGNNDSGCGDYFESPDSGFLKAAGNSLAEDLPDGASRDQLRAAFSRMGDYSVMLPAPMHDTRLIVLQNIFESSHYKECSGQPNPAAAQEQIEWLRKELTDARAAGEQVWVMAHIPPGVDVYTTYHRYLFAPGEACNVKQPQMYLSTEEMGDTIAEFGDIVRLAIFAHTHMDEIKILNGPNGAAVPAKLVPSISPINGNEPGFMVAQVSPQTATLKDYEVYVASNAQGTSWGREYRFSDTYHLPDFSGQSVEQLTSQLIGDKTGEDETSRAYERYFLAGGGTFAELGLQRLWPEYSCSLRERDPAAFRRCMCSDSAPHTP